MTRAIPSMVQLVAGVTGGVAAGVAMGALSPYAYVMGLDVLVIGLVVGALVGVISLTLGAPVGRAATIAALLGVVAGWTGARAMEDAHFVDVWTLDWAMSRAAASGLPAEAPLPDEELPFYARGAEGALERQVEEVAGVGGPVGRFLFRAEAGIRLLGPWSGSRVLPVGLAGALLWAVLELLLGFVVARKLLGKIRLNRRSG